MKKDYPIIIIYDKKNWYYAECPLFDGCYTQWDSLNEVLENIKEVIIMCEKENKNNQYNFSNILLTYTSIDEWKISKIYSKRSSKKITKN